MQLYRHPKFQKLGLTTAQCYQSVHLVTGKWSVTDWSKKDCRVMQRLLDKYPGSAHSTTFKILDELYRKNPNTWKKLFYLFRNDYPHGLRGRFIAAASGNVCQLCSRFMCRGAVCRDCLTTEQGRQLSIQHTRKLQIEGLKAKYGPAVSNPSQVKEVQETKRQRQLEKSGGRYSHHSQDPEVIAKVREAWRNKDKETIRRISEQRSATYRAKTGYSHPRHNPEVEKKRSAKIRATWGTDNPFTSPKFRAHLNALWLERYGYEEIFSSPEVQKKIRQRHMSNHGTANPMGNPEYLVRALKRRTIYTDYGGSTYRVGSSSEVVALRWLVDRYRTVYTQYDVGHYRDQYKWRPDFWIPEQGFFVEVKSVYTLLYGLGGDAYPTNVQKAEQSPNVRWLVEHRKHLIPLPKSWHQSNPFQLSWFIAEKTQHLFKEQVLDFLASLNCEVVDKGSYLLVKVGKKRSRILLRSIVQHSSYGYREDVEFKTLKNAVILWDYVWNTRRRAARSYLRNHLGLTKHAIGARSCEVHKSTKLTKDLKTFFGSTHIQGSADGLSSKGVIYYLTHGGRIVSAMIFDRTVSNRGTRDSNVYELTRFATSKRVNGGASRLFAAFRRDHEFESVVSYSDVQSFSGGLYRILGFKEHSQVKPSYRAVWDAALPSVKSKQSVRLERLSRIPGFDPALTERENCRNLGIRRVWDQGLIKWVYTP